MKKHFRQMLSLILSLMMIMSMFAGLNISSFAEDDILSYLSYEINDGEVTITDCSTSLSGDVTIPDTIEGYPVTVIGGYAFSSCWKLENITIPASVATINVTAFDDCDSLAKIIVNTSNKSYSSDEYGVLFNKNKTELLQYPEGNTRSEYVIPGSVTTIGAEAFYSCDNLVSIVIPDNVVTISNHAFYWCRYLENVQIGKSVTTIGDFAFNSCSELKSMIIPESVTSIGENVFSAGFESACDWFVIYGTPGSAAENYAKQNSIITFVDITTFPADPSANVGLAYVDWKLNGEEVSITYCDKSYSGDIIIPSKINGYPVTEISNSAFSECSKLTGISFPDSLITIGNYAFENCKNLKTITIPDSVTTIGTGSFNFCNGLTSVTIGNGVTIIDNSAFKGCSRLENVKIGNSVTTIGSSAFADCSKLKSISIPDSVTTIGSSAFEGSRLESVTIGNGVTMIDRNAFQFCDNLTEITIPDNVTTIGDRAFNFCSQLESVTIGNGVTTIGDYAFDSCPELKSITIPDSVTSIGKCSFGYGMGSVVYADFEIYGTPGTAAETYAKANDITFISVVPEKPPVEEPPVEKPPVEEPPVEKPPVEEPPVEEPPVEKPPVEEPPVEKPPVEEPAGEGDLKVKNEGGITIDSENKISQIGKGESVESLSEMIENKNFAIVDKNGKALDKKDLVGTGSKIQILDSDGKILNEYTVLVPADIDGNGKTTAADARLALRSSAKLDTLEGVYNMAADVTGDGKVNASDARKILRISAGLEK